MTRVYGTAESFKVRRTVVEMLIDRGYMVQSDDISSWSAEMLLGQTFQDFEAEFHTAPFSWKILGTHKLRKSNANSLNQETIKVRPVPVIDKELIDKLRVETQNKETRPLDRIIYVIYGREGKKLDSPNKTIQARIDEAQRANGIIIEHFLVTRLLINITRHVLVPKHVLLSEMEKSVVLKEYRCTEGQIPIIESSDPMARYLGLLPNDVVRISRPSETVGIYTTFRICH